MNYSKEIIELLANESKELNIEILSKALEQSIHDMLVNKCCYDCEKVGHCYKNCKLEKLTTMYFKEYYENAKLYVLAKNKETK